ncbi:MAG: hypothetical protein ACK4FK_17310 [Ferrovibrio sp.]|uniref:hypothetical protein n=1 Tax=Ferrovibrio sp. TaxID=1917215 RepID=UPI00391A9607
MIRLFSSLLLICAVPSALAQQPSEWDRTNAEIRRMEQGREMRQLDFQRRQDEESRRQDTERRRANEEERQRTREIEQRRLEDQRRR